MSKLIRLSLQSGLIIQRHPPDRLICPDPALLLLYDVTEFVHQVFFLTRPDINFIPLRICKRLKLCGLRRIIMNPHIVERQT